MGTASSTSGTPRLGSPAPYQTTYNSSFNPPRRQSGPNYGNGNPQVRVTPHYPHQMAPTPTAPPPAAPYVGFRTDIMYSGPQEAPPDYSIYPSLSSPAPCQPDHEADSYYPPDDCSRDVVLSRLMAAEEFLQHMEETDRRIQVMSEVNNRGDVLEQLTEALGLRGHMQDELLRILAMLTDDSPDLNCLTQFERQYPKLVGRLRDLDDKAKALRLLSNSDKGEIDSDLINFDPSLVRTMEAKLEEADIVAAQTESYPTIGPSNEANITEGDLKVKHQVEEQTVSSNFASRVMEAAPAGPEAIDRLLEEHATSMQALRDRQNTERRRVLTAVGARTRSTMTSAGATTSQTGTMTSSGNAQTDNVQRIQKSYVSQINFASDGEMTVITPGDDAVTPGGRGGRPVGTAAVIRSGTVGVEDKVHKDLNSDDELEDLITAATSVQSGINENEEFDEFWPGESEDTKGARVEGTPQIPAVQESQEFRTTFTKDMWDKRKNMTTEDFKAIISDFRSQEEERRRMRHAEKDKHKKSMLAKLAESRRKGTPSPNPSDQQDKANHVTANGGKAGNNEVDFAAIRRNAELEDAEARRMHAGERSRLDQKLKDKLNNQKNTTEDSVDDLTTCIDEEVGEADEAFISQLRRRGMNDVDIDELLRRHLQEAEEIRRRKFAEKSRLDDRLREILGSKNKKGFEQMDDNLEKDMAAMDEELARRVRSRPNVKPQDVDDLLSKHRRQQEQLLRARAAQRQRGDERLQAKLQQHSGLKMDNEETEATDEQFFDRLQKLQRSGDLTQDAFQDMLRQYLSNVDNQRQTELKEQRRRLREEEKLREQEAHAAEQTASTLVTEHQEKTKQLHNTRQRERRALDAKLQEKLKQSKKQKQDVEEGDLYDF